MTTEQKIDHAAVGREYADNLLGEPAVSKCLHAMADEIERLREAIRRLAEQDATLSLLCKRDGSQVVTVTMDATLTDEEREAIGRIAGYHDIHVSMDDRDTLQGLLERTK